MPQIKVNFGPKVGGAAKKTTTPTKISTGGAKKVNPFLKNDAAKKTEVKPAASAPAPAKTAPAPAAPAPKEVTVDLAADKEVTVKVAAPRGGKAPHVVEQVSSQGDIKEGGIILLECVCEGEPEPDVDWYLNGKIVKDEGRWKYVFEKDGGIGLEISDATKADEGEYKCVLTNKSGKAESSTKVSVTAKPKAEPKVEPKADPKVEPSKPKKDSASVEAPRKRNKKKSLPIQRDGIKPENPEKYYEFGDEIGRGKFSVVKYATNKSTGQKYAAKIVKFDSDSLKFAIREYDFMVSGKSNLKGLVQLHEAYLVQKYLILIMDLVDGKTLLDKVASMHSITEDDVAGFIKQLLEILEQMHANRLIHLDLRPTNIRFSSGRELKILDYNSCRHIANKKAGEVVDVIGDTEFCAPEMLNFEPIQPGSDMWTIGVLAYVMLSGISPFFYEDEDKVIASVQKVKWEFDEAAFESVTSEAKDFIKKMFIRAPENRMTAEIALKHKWLSADYQNQRKKSQLTCQDVMKETDERLYSEEEEEYVEASLVFRTFDEEEYESPEESSDEEED